jgi:hypothetical protein
VPSYVRHCVLLVAEIPSAVWGFAGVALGGLVTYLVQRRADDRADAREREQRAVERQREIAADARQMLGIARVYEDELTRVAAVVRLVRKGEAWDRGSINEAMFKQLPEDERRLFAARSGADWDTLTRAHMGRDTVMEIAMTTDGKPADEKKRKDLEGPEEAINAGKRVLKRLEREAQAELDEAEAELNRLTAGSS